MNVPVTQTNIRVLSSPPEGATQLRSIPDHVPTPELRWKDARVVALYDYRNANGSRAFLVARVETAEGKRILPLTVWSTPDGRLEWCYRLLPDQRPLYRLPQLLVEASKPVLISEGEKCADAAAGFGDYASVTWAGGCKALSQTDLTPLAGRDVIILPDHDEPGQDVATQLEQRLQEIGAASIRRLDIVRLAEACGLEAVPGFDIADAIAAGLDAARFEQLLAMPALAPPADNPEALPEDLVQREVFAQFRFRPDNLPAVFSLTSDGLIKHDVDRHGRPVDVYAGSPLIVWGRTHAVRDGWGYRVALRTPAGEWVTRTIPARLLAGDGRELRELLADAGAILPQSRAGRQALAEYIGYAQNAPIVDLATRPGWHGDSFVLPDRVIRPGDAKNDIRLEMDGRPHFLTQAGSLPGWQELARLAENNSRAAFAICIALAAPLLGMMNLSGGGFHLFGQSSRGKTTLLTLAGSVWGGGGNDGFVRNWRMTDNGAEGLLSDHNDLLLPLDELTAVAPETAAELYYLLANGHGKTRATRDGDARASTQSRTLVLSSGENSAAQQIELARGRVRMTGGLAVRMLDIPIEHAPGESFEDLGKFRSAGDLAEAMAGIARTDFGHAGPAFVQSIIDRRAAVVEETKEKISRFIGKMVDVNDDPQVRRAATQFGLVSAAGQLAAEAEILPWNEASASLAAERCFAAWKMQRGGGASHEERAALAHLKSFFESHGRTRFDLVLDSSEKDDTCVVRVDDRPVRDRCGYRVEADGEGTIFYVLPEAFRIEVCGGHNPDLIIRIARAHEALIEGDPGHVQKKVRLPDYPSGKRVYALRPDLLP